MAVIPLGAPLLAKSRLAGALSQSQRQALTRWMAERVIGALHDSGAVAQVAVVSPDQATLIWASALGATPILQPAAMPNASADTRLNDGLALGRAWAEAMEADALLITLGDLPLLTAAEVAQFVALARYATSRSTPGGHRPAPFIALAPDRASQGTNALLAAPPVETPLAFGLGSLARHGALAKQAGAEPLLFPSPGFAFDVDTVPDLEELGATCLWSPATMARAEMATNMPEHSQTTGAM